MRPFPWSYVEAWNCRACGFCCHGFKVVLGFNEWINVVRNYGVEFTEPCINRLCLKRGVDNACVFLQRFVNTWLCGLQHMKPKACRLWPFKIGTKPRFGRPKEASYIYRGRRLFIYVDPSCAGIRWGKPRNEFIYGTLTELVEIAMDLRKGQYYSTSKIPFLRMNLRSKGRWVI